LKAYTGILRFAVNYRLDKIFNRDRGNRRWAIHTYNAEDVEEQEK
jgi:hypothetical protein